MTVPVYGGYNILCMFTTADMYAIIANLSIAAAGVPPAKYDIRARFSSTSALLCSQETTPSIMILHCSVETEAAGIQGSLLCTSLH